MIDVARIHRWLATESGKHAEIGDLLAGLCEALLQAEMPLARVNLALHTLHPQVVGAGYTWRPGVTSVSPYWLRRGEYRTRRYLESPLPVVARERVPIRRKLTGRQPKLDFPIVRDLRKQGATDFVVLPIVFTTGTVNALSMATCAPEGFSDADIAAVQEILPLLSLALEVRESHRFAAVLLDTYLGHRTGAQVLRGQISRGDGQTIEAALWYCDLRDFTPTTTEQTPEQVIEWLNAYFEVLVCTVHAEGGEVLKFIGDAMLAIFAIESADGGWDACRRALAAALSALATLAARSEERVRAGKAPLRGGIALHVGEVVYGNIGAPDRLDFTVIGTAVNVVTRIAGLCAPLGQELLLSRAFAAEVSEILVSLGAHSLKGISDPEELFTVTEEQRSAIGELVVPPDGFGPESELPR